MQGRGQGGVRWGWQSAREGRRPLHTCQKMSCVKRFKWSDWKQKALPILPRQTKEMVQTKMTRRPRRSASAPNTTCPSTAPASAATPTPDCAPSNSCSAYRECRTFFTRLMTKRTYASDKKPTPDTNTCNGQEARAGAWQLAEIRVQTPQRA